MVVNFTVFWGVSLSTLLRSGFSLTKVPSQPVDVFDVVFVLLSGLPDLGLGSAVSGLECGSSVLSTLTSLVLVTIVDVYMVPPGLLDLPVGSDVSLGLRTLVLGLGPGASGLERGSWLLSMLTSLVSVTIVDV